MEYEDISELLCNWGYDKTVVDKFRDEGIEPSHLILLTEYSLEKLFPKIEERTIFMHKIKSLPTQETPAKKRRLSLDSDILSVASTSSVKTSFSSASNVLSLEQVLDGTDGKMILSFYKTEKKLNDFYRQRLADEIVRHELQNDIRKRVEVIVVPHLDYEPESLPVIKEKLKGVDAIIWNTKHRLTKPLLDIAGPSLKCVSTMSSGIDHIDTEEFKKRNLPLGHAPSALDNTVADIAVGLVIAAARRFKENVAELESGEWKYGVQWRLGQDIVGSTVGIVGLGGVGQAVVRRLRGFDVKRFVYSGRTDKPEAKALKAERVSTEQLLKESDYVILCCPLTEETRHLINDQTLGIMKKNAVLINIARGGVIDQDALHRALKENRIFAAGLDVVTPEPLPKDHPLVSLPNCYILPHVGSATIATRNAMSSISANNVLLALEGKPMVCPAI